MHDLNKNKKQNDLGISKIIVKIGPRKTVGHLIDKESVVKDPESGLYYGGDFIEYQNGSVIMPFDIKLVYQLKIIAGKYLKMRSTKSIKSIR